MKDINTILTELLEESGATVIITNPEDLLGLQKDGLKLDPVVSITPQEHVEKLFEAKKKLALDILNKIPTLPNVPIPTIGLLWKEIVGCVLFGNNGAAISLSAVLVEYALKEAIIKNKHSNGYNAEEWNRIEKIEFGTAIEEAKELNILSDDNTVRKFQDFKNQIRNPYLHYNIKKITKGVRANKVKKLDIKTQKVEEVQLDTENNPILWPYAKKFVDKNGLEEVLNFACYAVGLLLNKNYEKQRTPN